MDHACIHTYIHMCKCHIHIRRHEHTRTHTHTCTHIYTHSQDYTSITIYIPACVHTPHMYIYIYTCFTYTCIHAYRHIDVHKFLYVHFSSPLQSRSWRASSRDETRLASAYRCGFRIPELTLRARASGANTKRKALCNLQNSSLMIKEQIRGQERSFNLFITARLSTTVIISYR